MSDPLERDFYVIVTGAAEVRIGGDHIRELHDLMRTTPAVGRRVQAAARERLRRT